MQNRFSTLKLETEPEIMHEILSNGIIEASETSLSKIKQTFPKWMSQQTKNAIKNKHTIRKKHGSKSTNYKILEAESKKLVKKDQLKKIEDDIDQLISLPPDKMYLAAIKKLNTKPKNINRGIKDHNWDIITDKTFILERWATFYEKLYDNSSKTTFADDSCADDIPPILKSEVRNAINDLKNGKKPGLDHIYSKYIKAGGEPILKAMQHHFDCILSTGNIPSKFTKPLIVVIYKKGSRLDCGNYRSISLLSHVYKLFISIIAARVKSVSYESFSSSQAAYQPGRGTIEQILALEQIIEESIEFNDRVHITLIDLKIAFDCVRLSQLWH